MEAKLIKEQIGKWSAFFGFAAAAIMGFAQTTGGFTAMLLLVLGAIVGITNIEKKETQAFLVASIALMVVGSAGLENLPKLGKYMGPIFTNIATLISPAALIVALKTVFRKTKE